MKTLTWKDFEAFEPCYDPQKRYGSWKGTILDLMNHPEIPYVDKVWAFTREGIASDKTLRLFAVACAREVQHLLKDERSLKALDVAEAFAHGNATEKELRAALDSAWAAWAALDAAGAAAEAAAEAAAWAAAWDAAWAARAAAWAAAWAADETARAAARQKQVQIAIELINQHEK